MRADALMVCNTNNYGGRCFTESETPAFPVI